MDSNFFSLLYVNQKSKDSEVVLCNDVLDNIGIEDVKMIFKNTLRYSDRQKKQLNKMLTDKDAIVYRQEILTDMLNIQELRHDIDKILPKINNIICEKSEYSSRNHDPVRDILWKIEIFKQFSDCVEDLWVILNKHKANYKSKGLILLLERLSSIKEKSYYCAAKTLLPKIINKIDEMGTFTLDVHFNIDYIPMLTAISKSKNKYEDIFTIAEALFGTKDYKDRQSYSILSHSVPGIKHLYDQTFKNDCNNLIKEANPIINAYSDPDITFLCNLDYEFDFYLSAVQFYNFWVETDLPMCLPAILEHKENKCLAKDVFDMGLAIKIINSKGDVRNLIVNDVEFDDKSRIYILTGANRGGKTTYVRSIGILYILFQNGLYIPGSYAQISPVHNIFTHFPKEEAKIFGKGHLGEELSELKKILYEAQEGDLILLNESLSSTGMTDGLVICTDYIKVLSELGVKCVFATHIHPLANICKNLNSENSVLSRIDSLVTVVNDVIENGEKKQKRTYKIERRMADGESYADEIAKQYGLSYLQIIRGRKPVFDTVLSKKNFSLLYKETYIETKLDDKTCRDIGLDKLSDLVNDINPNYRSLLQRLKKIPTDHENILYRQEIFNEVISCKNFVDSLEGFIDDAAELEKKISDKYNDLPDHRRRLRWKLYTLQQYKKCVEALYKILGQKELKSGGFQKLFEVINEVRNCNEYAVINNMIPNLIKEIGRMKNIKIGMKFNLKLQPDKVKLCNIGHFQLPDKASQNTNTDTETVRVITAGEQKQVGKVKRFFQRIYSVVFEERWITMALAPKTTKRNPDIMIMNDIQRYVDECLNRLAEGMDTYISEHSRYIINIASELDFYTTGYRLVNNLIKLGIPMCKPIISKYTCIKGLCDITTGLLLYNDDKINKLVTNTIDFSYNKNIFIVTGPNQGGKTTFLRALGVAQIFFQGGLYVPAEQAEMVPICNLYTHFLKNEKRLLGEGRLDEELKELSGILYSITENDMLLMNESISCTTAYDGYIIAKNIVKALRDIGTKTVYSTHLHELADAVDQINNENVGKSRIVSLRAEVEEAEGGGFIRTYRISEGKSDGRSFAGDIALQQGMTYDLMNQILTNRKVEK